MAKTLHEQAVAARDEIQKRLDKANEKIDGKGNRVGLQDKANQANQHLTEAKDKRNVIAGEILKAQAAVDALANLDASVPDNQSVPVEGVPSGEGVGAEPVA